MFTVTVTERGEPSQAYEFEQDEVTIGRVRGNDIVLRRGSVSKRHAKFVMRDEKFIVIDLQSTNGTIVNGRKIVTPFPLRHGDKVVIGDYVLEVSPRAARSGDTPPRGVPSPPAARGGETTPPPDGATQLPVAAASPPAAASSGPASENPAVTTGRIVASSRIPLSLVRSSAGVDVPLSAWEALAAAPGFAGAHAAAVEAAMGSLGDDGVASVYPPNAEEHARAIAAVRDAIGECAAAFAGNELFLRLVVAEVAGAGPLDLYLDDPTVRHIHVTRHDRITLALDGGRTRAPITYASAASFAQTAERLAAGAQLADPYGGALRLPDGARLELVLPPVALDGPAVTVVRPLQEPDLVARAAGAATPQLLAVLSAALLAGGGVFVCGTHADDATAFAAAILRALPGHSRVVSVEAVRALTMASLDAVNLRHVLGASPSALVRAVALAPDVIAVDPLSGDMVGEWLLDVAASGAGVLATFAARGPSDALARLTGSASSSTRIDTEVVRRQIAHGVDLLVQLARRGGQLVVAEVVDIIGVERGVFQTATVFKGKLGPLGFDCTATGHVPQLFADLNASNVQFDANAFNA